MLVLVKELTLEAINSALLRIERSIQTGENNFQQNVARATVSVNNRNVSIGGGNSYDDTMLRNKITALQDSYDKLSTNVSTNSNKILALEAMLASVDFSYDASTNEITFSLGDYESTFQLKDTTYTFSYDDETGQFTITDNITGETVFNEVFKDTTYTFSFTNGVLTVHNNWTDTDQTFDFDTRYYTEAEIQALVLDKIPPEASSTNQLADKAFVNSSIATATATFRGTVTTTSALSQLTGDLNDYAYLQNIDPTTGQTTSYDRYKWVETGGDYGHWKYEYTLNNSSYTADQWAAINSGITCTIVQNLLDGCYSCTGSTLTKSAGNDWRNLIATNCNCSSPVLPTTNYYNTNIQVNQCTGELRATRLYATNPGGYALMAKQQLTASDIGLTAGTLYPICCILNQILDCFGGVAGTYSFEYSAGTSPKFCETNDNVYNATIVKYDDYSLNECRRITRWSVTNWDGREWSVQGWTTGGLTRYWAVCSCNAGSIVSCINRVCTTESTWCYPLLSNGVSNIPINTVYAAPTIMFLPTSGRIRLEPNTACFIDINPNATIYNLHINKASNTDKGLFISTGNDIDGTTYCNIGFEIGSGNNNRGIYHNKGGNFSWLQYWNSSDLEIHSCCILFNKPFILDGCTPKWQIVNLTGSSYSPNCLYPVVFYLGLSTAFGQGPVAYQGPVEIRIGNYLDTGCTADWMRHNKGFSATLSMFDVPNGWGTVPIKRWTVLKSVEWVKTDCGCIMGYCQMTNSSTGVLFLRGGACWRVWNSLGQAFYPHCTAYTASSQTVCPVLPANAPQEWCDGVSQMRVSYAETDWTKIKSYTYTHNTACSAFIRLGDVVNNQTVSTDYFVVACISGCTGQCSLIKLNVLGRGRSSQCNQDNIKMEYNSTYCAFYPISVFTTGSGIPVIEAAVCQGCTVTLDFYIRRNAYSPAISDSGSIYRFDVLCNIARSAFDICSIVLVNTSSNCNAGMLATALSANQVTAYCLATYSKRALKKDIQPFSHCALCLFRQTDVMSYRYKTEADDALVHVGFIADDTPMLLSGEHKDTMRINDTVGLLIEAVKELDERTMPLTNKIKEILKKWKKRLVK